MARPRAFDADRALDAAMTCFWRRGWEATSVRDLSAEMGLNCPSLYNAFGDKRALFTLVLERYAGRFLRERIARLEQHASPKAAITGYFDELIAQSVADAEQCGCLIINSAMEVAPNDRELCSVICSYLAEIEAFFRGRLLRAKAVGEVPADLPVDDMARLFLGLVLGLRVAARACPQAALFEGMVRPAFHLLDNSSNTAKETT